MVVTRLKCDKCGVLSEPAARRALHGAGSIRIGAIAMAMSVTLGWYHNPSDGTDQCPTCSGGKETYLAPIDVQARSQ